MSGTQNLAQGQQQVLQALYSTLSASESASASGSRPQLTPAHAKAITDKIESLLGGAQLSDGASFNDQGQPVNEEGLPIIEITEPATDSPSKPTPATLVDPIPTSAELSAEQLDARRKRMDRMFDLLEEEEAQEEANARAKEEAEAMRQSASSGNEQARLKAQREMQKKMGKALIANLAVAREKEAQVKADEEAIWKEDEDRRLKAQASNSSFHRKPRKSVSWAELPKGHTGTSKDRRISSPRDSKAPAKSGDVSLGTLQSTSTTMKHHIVERVPPSHVPDSDDESEPERSDSDEENRPPPSDADTEATLSGSESDDDPDYKPDFQVLDNDDVDFDSARHQREVVMEYYAKQGTVGAEIMKKMSTPTEGGGSHEWDQAEVPLDATLSREPPKPSASRFKASLKQGTAHKEPSVSGVASTSGLLSQPSAIRKAVRTGKVQNGKLVGPADDSASDEEEAEIREYMSMLERGEVTNLGQNPISATSTEAEVGVSSTQPTAGPLSDTDKGLSPGFARALSALDSLAPSPVSPVSTPISTIERSSPKLGSLTGAPNPMRSQVMERVPRGNPISVPTSSSKPPERHVPVTNHVAKQPTQPNAMPSMIVDSPSFPRPGQFESAPAETPKRTSRFKQNRE